MIPSPDTTRGTFTQSIIRQCLVGPGFIEGEETCVLIVL